MNISQKIAEKAEALFQCESEVQLSYIYANSDTHFGEGKLRRKPADGNLWNPRGACSL